MPEVIPVIIPKDFAELQAKIKLVEPHVKTVQLDVADGIFVDNVTWPYLDNKENPFDYARGKKISVSELDKSDADIFLEAHLMIDAPHRVLNEWLNSQVKRVILHWEALEKIHNHELLPYKTQVTAGFPVSNLSEETHKRGKELGVALNVETPVSVLDNFISCIDVVLLMSVKTGWGGQKFDDRVIPKIVALRQKYPNVKIEVDGGINVGNIAKLVGAGADFLVVGSAIFENKDIGGAIEQLKSALSEHT